MGVQGSPQDLFYMVALPSTHAGGFMTMFRSPLRTTYNRFGIRKYDGFSDIQDGASAAVETLHIVFVVL